MLCVEGGPCHSFKQTLECSGFGQPCTGPWSDIRHPQCNLKALDSALKSPNLIRLSSVQAMWAAILPLDVAKTRIQTAYPGRCAASPRCAACLPFAAADSGMLVG